MIKFSQLPEHIQDNIRTLIEYYSEIDEQINIFEKIVEFVQNIDEEVRQEEMVVNLSIDVLTQIRTELENLYNRRQLMAEKLEPELMKKYTQEYGEIDLSELLNI